MHPTMKKKKKLSLRGVATMVQDWTASRLQTIIIVDNLSPNVTLVFTWKEFRTIQILRFQGFLD